MFVVSLHNQKLTNTKQNKTKLKMNAIVTYPTNTINIWNIWEKHAPTLSLLFIFMLIALLETKINKRSRDVSANGARKPTINLYSPAQLRR